MKENVLTKEKIFENFVGDGTLLQYLRDNANLKTIPRDFLLCVIALCIINIKESKEVQCESKFIEPK